MELNINQKCQLVISGEWDVVNFNSPEEHKIELIVHAEDPSIYMIEIDRTSKELIWDLEKDGLYIYRQINWPKDKELGDNVVETLFLKFPDPTNSIDYVDKNIFSICKLRNCVLQLEKEAIRNFASNCSKNKCEKDESRSNKDILLISIFVLENLICRERYSEATMILDSLATCGNLCPTKITKCNCNE